MFPLNVALCGNVFIGEGTQIGIGSCVVPGVKIGKWSLIRAGSVVAGDILDYCIAWGNTRKLIKYKYMFENILTEERGENVIYSYPFDLLYLAIAY